MPKLKTSLFIDVAVWREIKKAAIDCGKRLANLSRCCLCAGWGATLTATQLIRRALKTGSLRLSPQL